jgi:osmotically-inducible protein OsmY
MGALPHLQDFDDLVMAPPGRSSRTDEEIAHEVARVLDWTAPLPGRISASVDSGCVTLEGSVGFRYQKKAAERAVRRLMGVRTVENHVEIATTQAAEDMRNSIRSSIRRRLDQLVAIELVLNAE